MCPEVYRRWISIFLTCMVVASGKVLEKGTLVLTLHSLKARLLFHIIDAKTHNFRNVATISQRVANLNTGLCKDKIFPHLF